MRRFLVCIHDATPAFARETQLMMRELAPLIGRRFSMGVVPDWDGEWPLAAHEDYAALIQAGCEELLLHGHSHRRSRGRGPISLLTGSSDEMNGMDADETRCTVERGQRVFTEVFGRPARGFIAPAGQAGHVRPHNANSFGLEYVFGFFALESFRGRHVPLATWTWDCGRWGWFGRVGHGVGWLRQSLSRGVPALAIHPRDVERGFWSTILRLTGTLIESGYEPCTAAGVLEASDVEVNV
jgi:hypothetical protein